MPPAPGIALPVTAVRASSLDVEAREPELSAAIRAAVKAASVVCAPNNAAAVRATEHAATGRTVESKPAAYKWMSGYQLRILTVANGDNGWMAVYNVIFDGETWNASETDEPFWELSQTGGVPVIIL